MKKGRKSPGVQRFQPCECCGYPLSHRHHLLPVSRWGESDRTVQLCPNCHELIHLILSALGCGKPMEELTQARRSLGTYWRSDFHAKNPERYDYLHELANDSRNKEIEFEAARVFAKVAENPFGVFEAFGIFQSLFVGPGPEEGES